MKIVFFSVVKYHTNKAYGVAIGYTSQASIDLGHDVLIRTTDELIHSINKSKSLLLLFIEKMITIQFGSSFLKK
jgi:hypothetical protein